MKLINQFDERTAKIRMPNAITISKKPGVNESKVLPGGQEKLKISGLNRCQLPTAHCDPYQFL